MHPSPHNLLAAACRIARVLLLVLPAARDDSSSPTPPDDIPATPQEDNRSGTRLKLMWDNFDGTKVFLRAIFDTLLDTPCVPHLWSDGNRYCTPPAGEVVYQDAACTMPLGMLELDECTQTERPSSAYFGSPEIDECKGAIFYSELRRGERRSNVPFFHRPSSLDSASWARSTSSSLQRSASLFPSATSSSTTASPRSRSPTSQRALRAETPERARAHAHI